VTFSDRKMHNMQANVVANNFAFAKRFHKIDFGLKRTSVVNFMEAC